MRIDHTPAPWRRTFRGSATNATIVGPSHVRDKIATVHLRRTVTNNVSERDANADLITEAPAMLAALERIAGQLAHAGPKSAAEARAIAQAAIARVRSA